MFVRAKDRADIDAQINEFRQKGGEIQQLGNEMAGTSPRFVIDGKKIISHEELPRRKESRK